MAETQIDQSSTSLKPGKGKGVQRVLQKVTKEMYRRNYELAQTNKTLSLLRQVDSIALASHESFNIYLDKLTEAIVKTAEYPFVEVLAKPLSHASLANYFGLSSTTKLSEEQRNLLGSIKINDDAPWYKEDKQALVIYPQDLFHSGIELAADVKTHKDKILEALEKDIKAKSLILVKLSSRQNIVGVMIFGLQHDRDNIDEADLSLIQRLGNSIGVAVDSKLLFEENKRVANQLQKANDKLKALDEAKDDFISMASHQLRTPLTSVKGYLSLVLDGDSGKVSQSQRELLNQAFSSSQRMVYLISDLLNVSRLRTGKFVIEPTPVNLVNVVEEEIAQLKEALESRKLAITYDKPKDFPALMLDENKTRQVVMNFVDNAIYYTPTGGKIEVKLIDNPQTVEMRVIDNGIGVAKSEQHHLFTKFYRANNARQARPDGTGLGLFMAKKVILAEGGSVIFESEEGKGSTFGFMFSKSKLAPPKGKVPIKTEEEIQKTN